MPTVDKKVMQVVSTRRGYSMVVPLADSSKRMMMGLAIRKQRIGNTVVTAIPENVAEAFRIIEHWESVNDLADVQWDVNGIGNTRGEIECDCLVLKEGDPL